jgi:hypothetical protein
VPSVDRGIEDRFQIAPRYSQLDLVATDAGDVEQVVGQPHELLDLPQHRLMKTVEFGDIVSDERPCLKRVADRRERIAQFVSKHSEELVLSLVSLSQRLLDAAPLGDFFLQRLVEPRQFHRPIPNALFEFFVKFAQRFL